MITTSNLQWVRAAAAAIACGGAVWLAAPSGWLLARGPSDTGRVSPPPAAVTGADDAGAVPLDDAAAHATRDTETGRFETFALDDAQQGAAGDLAARRAGLDAGQLQPDAMIAQAAGGRYAAVDVQVPAVAPQVAASH